LAGLGGFLEGAVVDLDTTGNTNNAQQRTQNGKRDVRRVEVQSGETSVVIHVVRERGWRISDGEIPGVTQERRLSLATGEIILPQGGATGSREPTSPGGHPGHPSKGKGKGKRTDRNFEVQELTPEKRQARDQAVTQAIADSDARGLVGLWEWCRLPEVDEDVHGVPDEMWGVYSEEQNTDIEAAFRQLELSIAVCVGIRSFQILFDRSDGGKQVDTAMKKRRFVRRRLVAPEEKLRMLQAAAEDEAAALSPELADMECAICCTGFAETPSIPVVKLSPCGHCFHGACVQHLADRRKECPFCRAEVDWRNTLAPKPAPTISRAVKIESL